MMLDSMHARVVTVLLQGLALVVMPATSALYFGVLWGCVYTAALTVVGGDTMLINA